MSSLGNLKDFFLNTFIDIYYLAVDSEAELAPQLHRLTSWEGRVGAARCPRFPSFCWLGDRQKVTGLHDPWPQRWKSCLNSAVAVRESGVVVMKSLRSIFAESSTRGAESWGGALAGRQGGALWLAAVLTDIHRGGSGGSRSDAQWHDQPIRDHAAVSETRRPAETANVCSASPNILWSESTGAGKELQTYFTPFQNRRILFFLGNIPTFSSRFWTLRYRWTTGASYSSSDVLRSPRNTTGRRILRVPPPNKRSRSGSQINL